MKGVSAFHQVFADHVQNHGKLLTHEEGWFLAGFGQALAESDGDLFSVDGVQVKDLADLVSDAGILGILKHEVFFSKQVIFKLGKVDLSKKIFGKIIDLKKGLPEQAHSRIFHRRNS